MGGSPFRGTGLPGRCAKAGPIGLGGEDLGISVEGLNLGLHRVRDSGWVQGLGFRVKGLWFSCFFFFFLCRVEGGGFWFRVLKVTGLRVINGISVFHSITLEIAAEK